MRPTKFIHHPKIDKDGYSIILSCILGLQIQKQPFIAARECQFWKPPIWPT